MSSPSPASISLEQLAALNDEIAALVRAGIPLDRGLQALGADLPGRLGRLTESLGQRLEQGEDLPRALEHSGDSFPPVYRAVVLAGLKSGRLPAALEGVSTTIRRVTDTRRVMVVGLIYPWIVFSVATLVLIFSVRYATPAVADAYAAFGMESPVWYDVLYAVSRFLATWLPAVWLMATVLVVAWYFWSRRAATIGRRGRAGTIRGMLHLGRVATFAEVLALLIERGVPLDEAVRLSADASGDAELRRGGAALAERIHDGQVVDVPPEGLPPLLSWLLASRPPRERLIRSLRRTAASYRRRARQTANWLGLYLPILLSAGLGGVLALFYVLLILAPVYHLLYRLG